jgi:uncharacterized membrane protein
MAKHRANELSSPMNQAFIASFGATVVEVLETVAIAYALVRAGFAREAILASLLGMPLGCAAGLTLWPVHALFPVRWIRLGAGLLLTGMGIQWTQRSLRRLIAHTRPGWVADPLGRFSLASEQARPAGFSKLVFVAMMKSAIAEGFEVLIVIFPIAAATGRWAQVAGGAVTGLIAILLSAIVLHGQLKKVPEVWIKLASGVLLVMLGITFLLESL